MLGGERGFLQANEVNGNFMEAGMEDSLCIMGGRTEGEGSGGEEGAEAK